MKSEELQVATCSEPLSLEEEFAMQQKWESETDKATFVIVDRDRKMVRTVFFARENGENVSYENGENLFVRMARMFLVRMARMFLVRMVRMILVRMARMFLVRMVKMFLVRMVRMFL